MCRRSGISCHFRYREENRRKYLYLFRSLTRHTLQSDVIVYILRNDIDVVPIGYCRNDEMTIDFLRHERFFSLWSFALIIAVRYHVQLQVAQNVFLHNVHMIENGSALLTIEVSVIVFFDKNY